MRRLLLSLLVLAAVAHARSIKVDDFAVDIAIDADGTVKVIETLTIAFEGSWNGIYRFIPYRYTYPNGLRDTLHLAIESITDGSGNELWNDVSHEGDNLTLKIAVPGAQDATRTVVIRYRSRNALRAYGNAEGYDSHDELYWNVTGTGWPSWIRHASATVTLPAGVPAGEVRTAAFTGAYGSVASNQETERLEDGRIRFSTVKALHPWEGLTIVVGFPPGHVRFPTWIEKAWWVVQANWGVLIPLGAAAAWFLLWWYRGRDSLPGTIIPEFEPPFDLRPSEVGVLADEQVDPRDVSACIVDLAWRGYFDVDVTGDEPTFRLKREWRADPTLRPHEEAVLDGLFRGGSKTGTADPDRLGRKMDEIRAAVYTAVIEGGFFKSRPDTLKTRWLLGTVVLLIPLGLASVAWATWWVGLIALAVAVVVMLPCAAQMPRRTSRGLEALRRIRGMEDYLRTAEEERLKSLPRDHMEKLLPYAIALGVADRWTKLLHHLFDTPPEWYNGPENRAFPTSFRSFLRTTRSATHYTPPRTTSPWSGGGSSYRGGGSWSGGSGFSRRGGGFSGGGFGGGGGGGW